MATTTAGSRGNRQPTRGRWGLVVAAVLVQLALGAVYAWSVFNKPLQAEFGWSKAEVVLPFEVAIGTIFIGSLIGGRIQDRRGPRAGGARRRRALRRRRHAGRRWSSSSDQLWLLVLTYGVIGGFGLGAAYITPIAMLSKWFPDRRGLITGIAVGRLRLRRGHHRPGGEGAARRHQPQDQRRSCRSASRTWSRCCSGRRSSATRPPGYQVPGFTAGVRGAGRRRHPRLHLRSRRCAPRSGTCSPRSSRSTSTCGIALISQAAAAPPVHRRLAPRPPPRLVGVLGLFNGGGRIVWAWLPTGSAG